MNLPSAVDFLKITFLSGLFTFIPLSLAAYFNEEMVLVPFLLIYYALVFVGITEKTPQKNDILIKFMTIPFTIIGFSLFMLLSSIDYKHAILNMVKDKNYLPVILTFGFVTFRIMKYIEYRLIKREGKIQWK